MTLDEAILHCKEIIENNPNNACKKCIDDHTQLLEWLMELKMYRQSKESLNKMLNEMRDLTEEERAAYNKYIESISIPTGINFWDYYNNLSSLTLYLSSHSHSITLSTLYP